jgi:hypothetical protein
MRLNDGYREFYDSGAGGLRPKAAKFGGSY